MGLSARVLLAGDKQARKRLINARPISHVVFSPQIHLAPIEFVACRLRFRSVVKCIFGNVCQMTTVVSHLLLVDAGPSIAC